MRRARVGIFLGGSALASGAAGQMFVNGGFETHDFTGWTVVNTTNGTGAPGQVQPTDIDGPGPLASSPAAMFLAGQAVPLLGVPEGVEMFQTLTLQAGRRYTVDFGWEVLSFNGAYADAGTFSIIVNDVILASQSAPFVSQSATAYGHVLGSFTAAAGGPHVVGVRITRPYPPGQFLRQFVDNVMISTPCYANCDGSTSAPALTVNDFVCFQSAFAAGQPYANCDGSTTPPTLTINDFVCFQAAFAAGCP